MSQRQLPSSISLSTNILYFPGHANIIVLNFGNKSLMIDCGRNINEAGEIRKKAEKQFRNKIEYVVLTHFHNDHTHSLPLFSDCQIIASEQLMKILKAAQRKKIKNYDEIYPNIVFEKVYNLKVTDIDIIIEQTGGHTPDSSYIYSPKHKLLAVGDNLRSDFLWGGRGSDPNNWISALQKYISFDVDHIIIGHGEIMTSKEVNSILAYVLEVKETINRLIKEGKKEEEIFISTKAIIPRGQYKVFIHDDTIKKWYKFWKKK